MEGKRLRGKPSPLFVFRESGHDPLQLVKFGLHLGHAPQLNLQLVEVLVDGLQGSVELVACDVLRSSKSRSPTQATRSRLARCARRTTRSRFAGCARRTTPSTLL
jgi:hypothetical protein